MSSTKLKAALLIVSTTAAQDPSTDKSEQVLKNVLETQGGGQWDLVETSIVPDVATKIQRQIMLWTDNAMETVNLVLTTGGTGFATSDDTPEAVSALLDKKAPGLVHGMLAASLSVTPFAMMSRPAAGVRNKTLIITLPGSPKGARENLQAVLKTLPHACLQAAGLDSRTLHAGGVKKLESEAGITASSSSGKPAEAAPSHSHDHHHHHHHHQHHHGHGHGTLVRHTTPGSNPLSNDPSLGPSRRNRESPYPMVSVEDALSLIETHTPGPITNPSAPVDPTTLPGSVLAADVRAPENVPAFRASIVDGYAVVVPPEGSGDMRGVYPVVAVSHATAASDARELKQGEIARITTGAPLPPGANSVIMVEDTVLRSTKPKTNPNNLSQGQQQQVEEENEVELLAQDVRPGENIREVGSDVAMGQLLLRKGEQVSAVGGEMGLLSSVGLGAVSVYARPVVGVLSTGDEIVESGSVTPGNLRYGEVRDTNRPTLLAAAREALGGGGVGATGGIIDLGIAADSPGTLEEALRSALGRVDVLVTTGGVSMGELDLLKPTLERKLGGTIHFGRVAMKPGKPTTFATVPAGYIKDPATGHRDGGGRPKVVFSLPGNPASALVTFHLFVLPALHKIAGIEGPSSGEEDEESGGGSSRRITTRRGLPRVPVVLGHDFPLDKVRPEYHRAVVEAVRETGGGSAAAAKLVATSTGGQRSSKVGSLRGANALLCMPAGKDPLPKGSVVDALMMGSVMGVV